MTLTGTGGFVWDIQTDGSILDGTSDAYDGMYGVRVDGTVFAPAAGTSTYASGRGLVTGTQTLSGLTVQRRVFVADAGSRWGDDTTGWVRHEDIYTNPTGAPITVAVQVFGSLGSGAGTQYTGSSDGDIAPEPTDEWTATDDADRRADPSLAHIVYGDSPGARPPSAHTAVLNVLTWTFPITVAAGETARVITFGVQASNRGAAENLAEKLRIWSIPEQWDALTGTELSEVVNWDFTSPTGATPLTGGGGIVWDPMPGLGALEDGTGNAYDTMYMADINGTPYDAVGIPMLLIEQGQFVVMGPTTVGDLRVQRMWSIPADGDPIVRGQIVAHNISGMGVPTTVRIHGNLGSNTATAATNTSSGDTTITGGDFWAVTDDGDGVDSPTLGHVVDDTAGPAAFSLGSPLLDDLEWTYATSTTPAGDALIWTFFAIQGADRVTTDGLVEETSNTGQELVDVPFPQSQNMAAFAPAWSSRQATWLMDYQQFITDDGANYDIDMTEGNLRSGVQCGGTCNSYDGMYRVQVGTTTVDYGSSFALARVTHSGQGYDLRGLTVNGIFVNRRYFTPSTGAGFMRFYNVFGNPDPAAVTPDIRMFGNLGSDAGTVVTDTADGDTMVEPTDSFYATDDGGSPGDASLAHVTMRDAMVTEPTDIASLSGDDLTWTYRAVSIPAASDVALLMFGVQSIDAATAEARAALLDDLSPTLDVGLTAAEIAAAVNFEIVLLPNGDPCTAGSECISGNCVDGVCCDTACGGGATDDCQACSTADGTTTDGTCGALTAAAAPGVTCRPMFGECDVEDVCRGGDTACPRDGVRPAGSVCRPMFDLCDVEEVCDGAAPGCAADAVQPSGVSCRAAADLCDAAEVCDGAVIACPADGVLPAGTECRAAAGLCDIAEACNGTLAACPANMMMADGVTCGDGLACNGDEVCASGVCASGTAFDCDDSNVCTADMCAEPGSCTNTPVVGCCMTNTECEDGDPCTTDTCNTANTCSSDAIPGCGPDGGMADGGTTTGDGGTTTGDGGTTTGDGGTTTGDGGTTTGDGGVRGPGVAGGGCSCNAVSSSPTPSRGGMMLLLGLLGAMFWRRGRRG